MPVDLKHLNADALLSRVRDMIMENETSLLARVEALVERAREDIAAIRDLAGISLVEDAVVLETKDVDLASPTSLAVRPFGELTFPDGSIRLSTSTFNNWRDHLAKPLPPGKYRLFVALLPIGEARMKATKVK